MADRDGVETAATERPVARVETAATAAPLPGLEPTLAQGSLGATTRTRARTSRARPVFLATAIIGATNLGYFVVRFLIGRGTPALHTVFESRARAGEVSVGFLDGPKVTLLSISVVAAVFLAVASWVAHRHRHDTMVQLMASLAVPGGQISLAVTQLTSADDIVVARVLAAAVYSLMPLGVFVIMAVFPSGKPVPRWALWAAPFATLPFVLQARVMFVEHDYSLAIARVALVPLCLFLCFQAYRFRRHATLHERNQIKWLCYAGGAFAAIQAVAVAGVLPLIMDPTRTAFPLLKLLYSVMIASSYLVGLACMLFSAARYRLWDIDRLINRTIVYVLATAVLAAAFVVAFFVLRIAVRAIEASDAVAIAVSLAVAVAFFPLARRRVGRWIDRRFYGIGLDYEALAAKAVRASALTTSHLGAYDELVLLGRGGMGAVYRAHHSQFAGPVALKVIAPALAADPDAQARFRREAQILEGMRHPHVVPFLASGHEEGLAYIAMEFADGTDLAHVLAARGRLPLPDVAAIITGVAEALDLAHARGVVHRDVKPANVLLERGDPNRALLMDFGVARLAGDRALPGDDALVGSLPYIAPEQIHEADRVDGRADIYSLAATAYELLTGRPPFRETSALAYVMAHLRQPPPDPRIHAPALPAITAAALLRGLAKAPADRFATAGELAAALMPAAESAS